MSNYDREIGNFRRGRNSKTASSGKTFLIVTEGEETEPQYLEGLRDRLKLSTIEILQAKGTDPMTLVKEAIDLRTQRRKEARKASSEVLAFDEVWCVLDSEIETKEKESVLKQALDLAKREKINVALSRPCFEYWLLLHETYTTKSFQDYEATKRELRRYYPEYEKNAVPTGSLIPKIPQAVLHARRVREEHLKSSTLSPATDMDQLVGALNDSARPHLQMEIPLCP